MLVPPFFEAASSAYATCIRNSVALPSSSNLFLLISSYDIMNMGSSSSLLAPLNNRIALCVLALLLTAHRAVPVCALPLPQGDAASQGSHSSRGQGDRTQFFRTTVCPRSTHSTRYMRAKERRPNPSTTPASPESSAGCCTHGDRAAAGCPCCCSVSVAAAVAGGSPPLPAAESAGRAVSAARVGGP